MGTYDEKRKDQIERDISAPPGSKTFTPEGNMAQNRLKSQQVPPPPPTPVIPPPPLTSPVYIPHLQKSPKQGNSEKKPWVKKEKVARPHITKEQHVRTLGKYVTFAMVIAIIYFSLTRLDGPAEAWSVTGALMSSPIIYRLLIGPLQLVLKVIAVIVLVATLGWGVIFLFILIRGIILAFNSSP